MDNDKVCTLIINGDKKVQPTPMDLQKKFEAASNLYMQKKDPKKLIEALEELLLFMVNGNSYPKLLMTIIRFVITCDDHRIKKLLGLYWELCDKVRDNGELKEEMVLVCNALRNDLIHANEFIRGRTLRLLCRMRYYKIMEPLIESILKNLSHRHAYVRRNAVTCVYSIVKTFGSDVIPQASVEIEQLLLVEGDLSTKRIAFIMLLNCDIDRAISYASTVEEQVTSLGDVFQLALLELCRKVARTRPHQKLKLMRIVYYLSNASSPAVMYECAQILSKYGNSPSASQIAATSFVNLLISQPDNNVKLLVLERLESMHANESERHIIESMIMDIIRGLTCPAIGVRRRIIALVTNSLTSRNVSDIVNSLRKEILKAASPENIGAEGNVEYRRLLIQTLQNACRQYPDFADSVVIVLTDLLRDQTNDAQTATDIISFLREVLSSNSQLCRIVIERLGELLPELNRSRVARMSLWLIGEFGLKEHAQIHIQGILNCLAPLPLTAVDKLVDVDVDKEATTVSSSPTTSESESKGGVISTRTVVLADGTYASQAVYGSVPKTITKNSSGIRNMIANGDVLLATVTGVVICKLLVKSGLIQNMSPQLKNEVLFAITCLTRVVKTALSFGGGREQLARLIHCVKVVASPRDSKILASAMKEWNSDACRISLTKLVAAETALRLKSNKSVISESVPSRGIEFRILKEKRDALVASDPQLLAAELGSSQAPEDSSDTIPGVLTSLSGLSKNSASLFTQRLNKAVAMTGLADSVYIEGFLRLHSFDLILELYIVNRTGETLQNILVELCTNGDLKVVEKPNAVTLGPGETATVYSTIRVSSTENGTIFGYATLDRKSALDKEWIVLNEVHADVVDYIVPKSSIMEASFKDMWQEFEWENKIVVNTCTNNPSEFIDMLCKCTNLCLVGTEEQVHVTKQLIDKSQFIAVNLYAKSIFDEDALVNVSIEKEADGRLAGTVRIRARNQGIALSLGDKVNQIQKDQLRGA